MVADLGVPAGSCAILIGVSAYEYAELAPIRAARNSLQAMRSLLSDPALCAWAPEQVVVIANPLSAADLATQITGLARTTTGVLLLYYVGHGLLTADGKLCLTVTSTQPDRPESSGLPWDTVADVLRSSPAHTRFSILDCCFAGQAIETPAGNRDQGLADITYVEGGYTLAATAPDRPAHVPRPEQQGTACTSFTGELRDLIVSGIAGGAPALTFSDIFPVLRERLLAGGLPVPSQRGTGPASQFAFTANAAVPGRPRPLAVHAGSLGIRAVPVQDPAVALHEPAVAGPRRSRHQHVVTEALRVAQSIADENRKARALVAVARAVACTDPSRAARLVADALRVAQSVSDAGQKASALAAVAGPLAVSDADAAETVATSIADVPLKASAEAAVAEALAATDPERAGRLIAEAERSAQSVADPDGKASALAAVAEALGIIDPDHAEQVVQSIHAASRRAPALAALAEAVATADPDRAGRLIADAERMARPIPGVSGRAPALAAVGKALAVIDAERAGRLIADAERSAQSIPGADGKASALAVVVAALAAVDPSHAERLAQSISVAGWRAPALAAVARALAAGDTAAPLSRLALPLTTLMPPEEPCSYRVPKRTIEATQREARGAGGCDEPATASAPPGGVEPIHGPGGPVRCPAIHAASP